jgi:dihydrodipicolinate reductase
MTQSSPLPVAVAGSRGRMGRALLGLLNGRGDLRLAGAFDHGEDALRDAALATAAVVIDFTSAEDRAPWPRSAPSGEARPW